MLARLIQEQKKSESLTVHVGVDVRLPLYTNSMFIVLKKEETLKLLLCKVSLAFADPPDFSAKSVRVVGVSVAVSIKRFRARV